jgi:hypothetical protein
MVLVSPMTVNTMANIKKIVDSITHLIYGQTVLKGVMMMFYFLALGCFTVAHLLYLNGY